MKTPYLYGGFKPTNKGVLEFSQSHKKKVDELIEKIKDLLVTEKIIR